MTQDTKKTYKKFKEKVYIQFGFDYEISVAKFWLFIFTIEILILFFLNQIGV